MLRPFSLLVIADPSRFGLKITNLPQIQPHSSCTKGVRFWPSTVLFIGSPQAADESVEASPGLAKRARAWSRRVWEAKEGASLVVDLGLTKLVEITEEFKNMCTTAHREREWRLVIP